MKGVISVFQFSDKVYQTLKWVLMIVVPAFIVYLTTLGDIWGFDPIKAIRTIAATAAMVGTCVGISCYNYNKPVDVDVEGMQYLEDGDEDE